MVNSYVLNISLLRLAQVISSLRVNNLQLLLQK